jgi:hypothetical protein
MKTNKKIKQKIKTGQTANLKEPYKGFTRIKLFKKENFFFRDF